MQFLALRTDEFVLFNYFWALPKSFLGLFHCLWLVLSWGALVCIMNTVYMFQKKKSSPLVWSSPQCLGTEPFSIQSNHIWLKLYFAVAIHGMLFGTANLFVSSAQWITGWKLLLQCKYSLPATVVLMCYFSGGNALGLSALPNYLSFLNVQASELFPQQPMLGCVVLRHRVLGCPKVKGTMIRHMQISINYLSKLLQAKEKKCAGCLSYLHTVKL